MSQQNIYSIQLLNDLHNYFPDILYNPRRFQNVQDLLAYIQSVANQTPFSRGYSIYSQQQTNRNNRHINPPRTPPIWTSFEAEIPPTRIRIPLNTANANTTANATANTTNSINNTLINTLLGSLLGETFEVPIRSNLQEFLNQRVYINPTEREIDSATILYNTSNRLENNCAICQDIIDVNEEVRRIHHCGHYFHRICIDTWFQQNVHCPTCRYDIRDFQDNLGNNPPPVPENYRRTSVRRQDSQ